jgi:predicted Rdx family selenoprotein
MIKRQLGVDAKLVQGGRGEFTIRVDGAVVYDKATTGTFPSDDAAVAAVRGAAGPAPGG